MNGCERLQVYQKGYRMVLEIYRVTQAFPKEERYAMTDQMRRAATSIPLNIAEGYAKKGSQKEFKRFLSMARGSSAEVNVLLDLSKDLGYISEAEYERLKTGNAEVGKMLTGLIQRIEEESNI